MNNPIATYRLQFHKAFTFEDLEALIPYLHKLGVNTIYASPVFKSTPGSTHGYDGVNPNEIDPEIGTLDQLKSISNHLKQDGLGWLQDIVPNHMAFHSGNPWLMDVLEKGRQSVYAGFFDIAWNSQLFQGKLMVPFLEADLEAVVEQDKLSIQYLNNQLVFKYYDAIFPLNARSYLTILRSESSLENQAVAQFVSQLSDMEDIEDAHVFSLRWNEVLLQLASLVQDLEVKIWLENQLKAINEDKARFHQILDQQSYVLCHWQKTEQEINFRRFFTVNGLICLNIQKEEVFDTYHQLIKTLIEEGVFQGLRIDHIDGLYNPDQYLEKIRALAGEDTYVVVEKILGKNEDIPERWPIQGTTGYEFLAWVNNLLTNPASEKAFTDFYVELTGAQESPNKQLLEKKAYILYQQMGGELENLYQLFVELNLTDKESLEKPGRENVKNAIGEFLIHCPVYRFYGNTLPLSETEKTSVQNIFDEIKKVHPQLSDGVALLEESFLIKPDQEDDDFRNRALEFYLRCMQFTGPLMAKGGEDTLMYTYNRFVGHNDVGDSPGSFGLSVDDFHKIMKRRKKNAPLSLNTTSTHDTKRGEDVRARLNVLTDLSEEWFSNVREWRQLNAPLKEKFSSPDNNDEYLVYQTLLGAYPMPGEDEDDFAGRVESYLQKALREAKTNSSYTTPNEAYEQGTQHFAAALLNRESPFWGKFSAFHQKVAEYGIINSLAQLLLKFTCPGTPDVYQGCELWDFSLVDPDNRRPADYGKRKRMLDEITTGDAGQLAGKLWQNRNSGQVKLWLTHQLFDLRRKNEALFSEGSYVPLKVEGIYKDKILAFGRSYKQTFIVTAVPLHAAALCAQQGKDFSDLDWGNTRIMMPGGLNAVWENVFTGTEKEHQDKIMVSDLFKSLPVALLRGRKVNKDRSAGVLMHISSLASPFGIGDMGPEAYAFADFLNRSNQKIWQLLPLNPTEPGQGNSPYSALSSRAGNPLLISPELLAEEGLLNEDDLSEYYLPQDGKTDYEGAERVKLELLEKAYEIFNDSNASFSTGEFEHFCADNKDWLDDFSLYMVLRNRHEGKAWTDWEEPFKLRDGQTLEALRVSEGDKIRFVQWVQFVFYRQWKSLRKYCNDREIKLLGDLPFYVSYNSSDVWAHRDLFLLDEDGKMTGVAGVPPDAFSTTGQLWGMPVFNWEVLKENGYQWWIERLRKNIELFDTVRLDHFRAFADYWVVPGDEETAENGEWKLGPDMEFFEAVQNALGSLPFVAEDLGEISPAVFALRDKLNLPGMKVLQFAFDENMPQSDYIPHHYKPNFIVYTGTHDNNTTRGWFAKDIDEETRSRLQDYVGRSLSEEDAYWVMARLAYASVAKTAILPIQDVLNLDETCKMNSPGSGDANWLWRLTPGQVTEDAAHFLRQLTTLFDRD